MLPARFTTADALVAFIAFAVADDITEPDTFMNTALAAALIAAAAPCAVTEPATTTGAVVITAFPNEVAVTFPNIDSVFVVFTAANVLVAPPLTLPVTIQMVFVVIP